MSYKDHWIPIPNVTRPLDYVLQWPVVKIVPDKLSLAEVQPGRQSLLIHSHFPILLLSPLNQWSGASLRLYSHKHSALLNQIPWCDHHWGPDLENQHHCSSEESPAAPVLHPEAQASRSITPHHAVLLPRRYLHFSAHLCCYCTETVLWTLKYIINILNCIPRLSRPFVLFNVHHVYLGPFCFLFDVYMSHC